MDCNKLTTNWFVVKPCPINNKLLFFNLSLTLSHSLISWTKFVCRQFTTIHYVSTNKIIHMYFSYITYLISHVTSLNNTCRWSYKLSHSRLLQTGYKSVCNQTLSLYLFFLIFRTKLLETTHSLYIPKTKEVSSLSLSQKSRLCIGWVG